MLIDTCIWSLALSGKRQRDKAITAKLTAVINAGNAQIIGPIRQELLSGYSDRNQFLKLKAQLEHFPEEAVLGEDYVTAAEFSNHCRVNGVQGSHTDFLICPRMLSIANFTDFRDLFDNLSSLSICIQFQSDFKSR